MHALAGTVTNVAFQSSDGQFARALWRIVISRICLRWAENARPGECMLARTSAWPFSGLSTIRSKQFRDNYGGAGSRSVNSQCLHPKRRSHPARVQIANPLRIQRLLPCCLI
jgi:hypothetical protein